MEDIEDYAGVMDGLRALRQQELFLDYTIEVEDQEFKFHKLLLASVSDYFKAMFSGGMVESQTDRVRLKGVSAAAVSNLIDFIYNGQLYSDTNKVSFEEATQCAVYLQMQTAIDNCIAVSECDGMNDYTCLFERLSTYQTYSMKVGIENTIALMISNFDELLRDWTPGEMTHHDVKNLIDVWQNSEWDLYLTIKQWVEVDCESRQQHVSDLMGHLRFGLMSPEQLEVIKGSDLFSGSEALWREEVEKHHSMPIHEKVLDASKENLVRDQPYPFYFNSDGPELYELSKGTSWRRLEASEKPEMRHGIETFVVVNNFLIVCEKFSTHQKWHILDPRTLKWSSMAELTIPRWDSALVSCNKHLYVLGGCPGPTDIIERYDFESNSWTVIPGKLPISVFRHGAAVIDDCIYVAGGLTSDGEPSTRLDCLNLSTGTWQSKPSLPESKSSQSLQVMERQSEKVLCIIGDGLYFLYYSPARDRWIKWNCSRYVRRWHSLQLKLNPDGFVLSCQNELFLLNVINGDNGYVCAKWTIDESDKPISQTTFEQLPVYYAGGGDFGKCFPRLMLLAVPPPPSAPLNMS